MSNLALTLPLLLVVLAVILRHAYLTARATERTNPHLTEDMEDVLDGMDWEFPEKRAA